MNRENDEGAWIVTFPYKIGFVFGVTAAVTALPLVFDLNTVLWFNDHFVHEDLPDGGVESEWAGRRGQGSSVRAECFWSVCADVLHLQPV